MCMAADQCNRMMSSNMDETRLKVHCRLQNKTLCRKGRDVQCVENRDECERSGGIPPDTKGLCDTQDEVCGILLTRSESNGNIASEGVNICVT